MDSFGPITVTPKPARRKPPVLAEHAEQVAFVNWFRMQYPRVLIHSIPNGAHLAGTDAQRAAKMARLKAEGLVPGVPDLFIPVWRVWVEMKRPGGVVSKEQRDVHARLRDAEYAVIVAYGWQDAREQVLRLRSEWERGAE